MPRTRRSLRTTGVVACVATAVLLSGCAGDPSPDPEPSPGTSTTGSPSAAGSTTATPAPKVPRPDGPAADISQRLTGGNGVFMGASTPEPLGPGYVLKEYAAKGRATAYEPVGALPADGRWTFEATDTARYRTRVVVRRPASGGDGIVLLEWLNVSGGLDTDPGYQNLRKEIVRQGHTWVGVSAQKIGVEGGKVAVAPTPPRGPGRHDVPGAASLLGKGLRAIDPERYGSLHHPGDRFAFDIVTQVARALRAGGPATGGEVPTEVLALGDSQAAFGLTTYVNGVQPLTRAFDGFFVMSRAGSAMVVPSGAKAARVGATILGPPTTFRTDTDVPIFDLQTESDVAGILGSSAARQPDTDLVRLWEAAGTAHADLHLIGHRTADALDCGPLINDGPLHVIAKAALRHFVDWVTDGTPPPTAPLLELAPPGTSYSPLTLLHGSLSRDVDNLALGGLRTPPVDEPTRQLSGAPYRDDELICLLFGSTRPMTKRRLSQLYADRADFVRRYAAGVDAAVADGFVLPEDRKALLRYAHPELVPD